MKYCVAPGCFRPENPDTAETCGCCGAKLLLKHRYQPIQPLGQGGFSRTFIAIDQDMPSAPRCVVKQLCPTTTGSRSFNQAERLFRQESVRLEELGSHPQIPRLFAHFEQNRRLYLVQEFIDGQSLDDELKAMGPFDEAKVRSLLQSIVPVLQFIHSHHVIHRDIKPANIMRRHSDGQLVLIDFGIAKQFTETMQAQTGTVVGTLDYMAPEQQQGKASPASDFYSLGVTCIRLLTGLSPADLFDSANDCWIWSDRLPPGQSVGFKLTKLINRLLERAVNRRLRTADAVLAALQESRRLTVNPAAIATASPPTDAVTAIGQMQAWLTSPVSPANLAHLSLNPDVDFSSLRKYLAKGDWEAADQETWTLLCKMLKKTSRSYIFSGDLARLPCYDLRLLDQLWVTYSQGRFGFSVQSQLYLNAERDYGSLCAQIGWPNTQKFTPQYGRNLPKGHLPSRIWLGGSQWWQHAEAMAERLLTCSRMPS